MTDTFADNEETKGRVANWVHQLHYNKLFPASGSISVGMINRIVRGAVLLGANRFAMFNQIKLDEARLRNPLGQIDVNSVLGLFEYLGTELCDPAIALQLGQYAAPRNFSDIGYAARLSASLADTIDTIVKMQQVRQQLFQVIFNVTDRPVTLTWDISGQDQNSIAPIIEFSLSSYARLADDVLNEKMQFRRISFAHAPRYDPAIYQSFFGCPVRFAADITSAQLNPSQLFRPSPTANEKVRNIANAGYNRPARWIAQGHKYSAYCYFFLITEIDKSPLTLKRMASSFGMSERTLRRALVAEGNPARELLDIVRRDLWEMYRVEGKRQLGEIAELLGYSELSAFSRSHQRWFGYPPSQY